MSAEVFLRHEFVQYIPEVLQERVLYVSLEYATAVHRCVCGCRREVVTPLSPTDWQLSFDGKAVSLDPSIGNWNFPCQSHYWIRRNRIHWAPRWTAAQIVAGRVQDRASKGAYFRNSPSESAAVANEPQVPAAAPGGIWSKVMRWLS